MEKQEEKSLAIRFMAGIDQNSTNTLMSVVENHLNQGFNVFKVLISSPGGSVQHGITAYNFLRGIPAKVETFNMGAIDSIATVIYCAGSNRHSVSNARFLIHSVTFSSPGPVAFEEKQLKEILLGLKIDRENIAKIIGDNCKKKQDDIEKIMPEGKTFDPQQAKEFGLVHRVNDAILDPNIPIIGIG